MASYTKGDLRSLIRQLEALVPVAPTKVFYQHFPVASGYATVAVVKQDENIVHYGVAFCSPDDNFGRSYGRYVALRKLVGKDTRTTRIDYGTDFNSMSPYELCAYALNRAVDVPSWVDEEAPFVDEIGSAC